MKRIAFWMMVLATLAVMAPGKAAAQGKFGPDSAECVKYLSYYQVYYKQGNLDDALPNWRQAFAICPSTASQNMFIHGTVLMNREYSRAKDPEARKALADTILLLQDRRMATYPKKRVDILNNKGQYMVNFFGSDAAYLYENLSQIVDELGARAAGGLQVNLLGSAITLFREGKVEADQVIDVYEKVAANIDGATAKNAAEAEDQQKAKATVDKMFAESGVASCQNIIKIFGPRFEADPTNQQLVSKVVKLMNDAEDCNSNELYLKAVTALYRMDPSYRSAYALYRLNFARGNFAEAIGFLQEAIDSNEADDATKAQYYYEMATRYFDANNRAKTAEAARKAIELDNGYAGKAYLIMGNLWAKAPATGKVIDDWARFWAATDYYQKARSADPSVGEAASAAISRMVQYYPPASEAFMYELEKGKQVTVTAGGLTATTTVRVQ